MFKLLKSARNPKAEDYGIEEPALQAWEKRGMLKKKDMMGWKEYYFYLSSNKLEFWKSRNAYLTEEESGRCDLIPLKGLEIISSSDKPNCYKLTTKPYNNTFLLCHEDKAVMEGWINQIRINSKNAGSVEAEIEFNRMGKAANTFGGLGMVGALVTSKATMGSMNQSVQNSVADSYTDMQDSVIIPRVLEAFQQAQSKNQKSVLYLALDVEAAVLCKTFQRQRLDASIYQQTLGLLDELTIQNENELGWAFEAVKGRILIANGDLQQGISALVSAFQKNANFRVFQWIVHAQEATHSVNMNQLKEMAALVYAKYGEEASQGWRPALYAIHLIYKNSNSLVPRKEVPFASKEDLDDYPQMWKPYFEQQEEVYKMNVEDLMTRVNLSPEDMLQTWYTELI